MLTQDEAKRWFNYNPISGKLTWAKSRQRIHKGDEVGNINSHGYKVVGLEGKVHKVHKVIWVYMTGDWLPKEVTVDHINGNKLDNRWINLRVATKQANSLNRHRANKNNSVGVLGVRKAGKRYAAYNGYQYLGRFDTVEEAASAIAKSKAS